MKRAPFPILQSINNACASHIRERTTGEQKKRERDVEETKVTQAAHEVERKTVRRTMPTQMSRLRVFANSPAPHFESGFGRIAETRMKGLPILNPRIRVKADNFRRWGNDWIGTVTTPWAVIVVYACGCRESWVDVPAGEVRTLELPAGDFPFLGYRDDLLGDYLMLSLVSPVTEFEDQAAAEAVAEIALRTILTVPEDEKFGTNYDTEEEGTPIPPLTPPVAGRKVIPIRAVPQGGADGGSVQVTRRGFFTRMAKGADK